MSNKLLLALAAAGAMTLAGASATYKVSILEDSSVNGKQVKAGDYRLEMKDNNTAVLKHGKQTIEVPAREETAPARYESTEIQYSNNNDLREIHVGGTNTKIVFATGNGPAE